MKKMIKDVIALLLMFAATYFAIHYFVAEAEGAEIPTRTAVIEYEYTTPNYTVAVFVGTSPGLDTTPNLHGALDTDEDKKVQLSGLVPGTTYYFRARAYENTSFIPTKWSEEIEWVCPLYTLPEPIQYPTIPSPSGPSVTGGAATVNTL
jgi:hypothetical protein